MFNYDKHRVLVFDTETNGLTPKESVLAVSCLSLELYHSAEENLIYMFAADFQVRYYHRASDEAVNPHALNVHQLTEQRIAQLREENGAFYPTRFVEDLSWFRPFLLSHNIIVGHNLAFDIRMTHSGDLLIEEPRKQFCTMKDPRDFYKAISPEPLKASVSLARAADLLDISYNKEGKHDATIDTFVTAKVFQAVMGEDSVASKIL